MSVTCSPAVRMVYMQLEMAGCRWLPSTQSAPCSCPTVILELSVRFQLSVYPSVHEQLSVRPSVCLKLCVCQSVCAWLSVCICLFAAVHLQFAAVFDCGLSVCSCLSIRLQLSLLECCTIPADYCNLVVVESSRGSSATCQLQRSCCHSRGRSVLAACCIYAGQHTAH